MKRDMDLIREVMIEIEKNPDPMTTADIDLTDYSPLEISYHIMLLAEHGFVRAVDFSSNDGLEWKAMRLTFDGHEFLDAARSDTVWRTAKEKIVSATGVITLEALKVMMPRVMKYMLTGHYD
jgi:DNA-binding transcriptional ArsR family regulator